MSHLIDSLLVKVSEAYARGEAPVLHPEGFVQLRLDEAGDKKLHVWHPDLPRYADPNTIHDHVWGMTSTVLVGEQINLEFVMQIDRGGDWQVWGVVDLADVAASATGCVDGVVREGLGGTVIAPLGVYARVTVRESRSIKLGEAYSMQSRVLHRSAAMRPTATYMRKYDRLAGQQPIVLAKRGENPDHSGEGARHHVNDLVAVIEEVLARGS